MLVDVFLLGTECKLRKGQEIRLVPATNLPDGWGKWFASPANVKDRNRWGDASILVSSDEVYFDAPDHPRLEVGSKIRVHGFVMLRGLAEGDYVVKVISTNEHGAAYSFRKARGKRVVAKHYAYSVDSWIRPSNHPDNNRIEVLKG